VADAVAMELGRGCGSTPGGGKIAKVNASAGDVVQIGQVLVEFE